MKRILYIIAICIACFAALCVPCAAAPSESIELDDELDRFLSDAEELLPPELELTLRDPDALSEQVGIEALLSQLYRQLSGEGSHLVSFGVLLLAMALFLSLTAAIGDGLGPSVSAAVYAVFSVALYESLSTVLYGAVDTVRSASSFLSGLLPLLGAVTVAGGGEVTAATQAMSVSTLLYALDLALSQILLPMLGVLLAFGLVGAIGDGGGVRTLVQQLSRLLTWGLSLIGTLFGATLTLQRIIASAQDSLLMRGAKYALSGMIPGVGGAVSGALSTLQTGLSFVKGSVGVGVVFVLLVLLLPPIVELILCRLALSVASGLVRMCTGSPCAVFDAFHGALSTLLAVACLSAVLLLLEVVLFMSCGSPLS